MTTKTGAALRRGRSEQCVATPREFLDAVEGRFGPIAWDLAANAENTVCGPAYYGPGSEHGEDALAQAWGLRAGNFWLNPPFANIEPWAAKCCSVRSRRGWLTMLVPASVGTNWYAEFVHNKALVLCLSPRITFVGSHDPYPKDMILVCYGYSVVGNEPWKWKQIVPRTRKSRRTP